MTKYLPIKENKDFQRAYARGRFYVSPILISYLIKNRKKVLRMGITTSKKTGNAVKRNRSRRVIRESFRSLADRVKPGYDLIFVARAKTPFVKCGDVRRVMEQQLKSAGLLL